MPRGGSWHLLPVCDECVREVKREGQRIVTYDCLGSHLSAGAYPLNFHGHSEYWLNDYRGLAHSARSEGKVLAESLQINLDIGPGPKLGREEPLGHESLWFSEKSYR